MPDNRKKKILVVDDEEDVVISLGNILKRANFEVFTADSGEGAIALTKKEHPDLIIMDILLSGMDGGSAAGELSQESSTADIPVIFLTGIINKEEERLRQKEMGAQAIRRYVMAKPVGKEELLELIHTILPE